MKLKNQFFALITLSLLLLGGCSYFEFNKTPQLLKKEYGGCFLGKIQLTDSDTIMYEVSNDTLYLHVIIRKNCNSLPSDSIVLDQENVNVYLKDTKEPVAYCNCDFKFTYKLANYSTIKNFNVYYKDFDLTTYKLWKTLEFISL